MPGTSAGSRRTEFAIVDPELGDRDWASIDPVRVRTSKGVRHRFTPAMYLWQRTRSHVWCESQEERWEVLWLDYGGQVERLWAQPLAIVFGHGSRLSGASHTPDFLAQFTDGTYGLFDVRPANRIDDHAELQFSESANVCADLGWHYRVLTGHDRLATQNLNSLSASRHDRCMPPPEIGAVILAAARDGITRGDLCRVASPACPPLACAWIDNLAWRRLLLLDLGDVFNSDTEFTTSDRALTGAAA
ncbi:hypothetical protein ACTU6U_04170 [Microbacterium sp. A196]|uniref:hypothetical protein n=1 Tax=Microbacterium sp. A196 TaxID=3457320 RepID=UPI003FD39A2C